MMLLVTVTSCTAVKVIESMNESSSGLNETEREFSVTFDSTAVYLDPFMDSEITASYPGASVVHAGLENVYDPGKFEPVWFDGVRLNDHAESLIRDVCRAGVDSLLPVDYEPARLREALDRVSREPSAASIAALDLKLSQTFMRYVDDQLAGRFDPESLPYDVSLEREKMPLDSILKATLAERAPSSFHASMQPAHPHFERLLEARRKYMDIAEEGGWPAIEIGEEPLEPGMTHPAVIDLRERLKIAGDLPLLSFSSDSLYDEKIAAGVATFQERHGIVVDSLVGPETLAALNTSVDERIRQIDINLERWRWLPQDLSDRYVLVNIPAYKVMAFEAGGEVLDMRVIVGAEYNEQQTPVFSDQMEFVVFRPYWNVPESIATEEIAPKAMEDPTFLARNQYEILEGEDVVEANEEAIEKLEKGEYRVRQKPGPHNALGLVKFIFPNRHAVYLHDSPADHLFDLQERDLSHGCIRLEDPPRFAQYVLGRQGWSPAQIDKAINEGERQDVQLESRIPVYLMYLTTFVHDDGTVSFYKDVYDYDVQLKSILEAQKRRTEAVSAEIQSVCQSLEAFQQRLL